MFAGIASATSIDDIVSDFPEYHTLRKGIMYRDRADMERRIDRLMESYEAETMDGWRVSTGDSWFLIRFSGTEPKVRISVESHDRERAEALMDEILKGLEVKG